MVVTKAISKIVSHGLGEILIIISAYLLYEVYNNSSGSLSIYSLIVLLVFVGSTLRIYSEEIIDFFLHNQWKRFKPRKQKVRSK